MSRTNHPKNISMFRRPASPGIGASHAGDFIRTPTGHPGRVRKIRKCVKLRHYFLHSISAPIFSGKSPANNPQSLIITKCDWFPRRSIRCGGGSGNRHLRTRIATEYSIVRQNYLSAGAAGQHPKMLFGRVVGGAHTITAPAFFTLKKLSPLGNGPQSRLIIFRVGAAGPIYLRPVFNTTFPKNEETHSSSSQFIRIRLAEYLAEGVGLPFSRRSFSGSHHKDGLAPKSGKYRFDDDIHISNPGCPFFLNLFQKRSSAATCADYTCFPAGSRRQTPFLCFPAPHDGARHHFTVRYISASLIPFYPPGRFRVGCRRVQSQISTVGPGPVFVVSLPKSGVVKPGFF